MNIFSNTLPPATTLLVEKIKQTQQLQDFYLSGGTALSLQLGHRESEDLDFFTQKPFQPQSLQIELAKTGSLRDVILEKNTLNVFMDNVKLQFLYYPYTLLEEPQVWNTLHLSSVIDIACTKLITISMRGSKKDFVDLYVILQTFSLQELLEKLGVKYRNVEYNSPHILKSLVYFDDAENQPMPKMHIQLDWDEVKKFLVQQVKSISFE